MDKIGKYEIIQKVGSGGMAHVFVAFDPDLKRQVAIKMMSGSLTRDPEFRLRFEREAEVIANLEHEYIIPVYEFGYHEDQPYLVMRYLMGGSLKERIEDYGPLSLSDAAAIMERMAAALEAAHRRGIVHRDFKPDNILMDTDGDTYLADFGIVKMLTGGVTTGGWIAGTPAYMAPEQVHGDAEIDGRADVYAMGVSLYEILSGKLPYWDPTPRA
jgi:serine/threonine-protein kinase